MDAHDVEFVLGGIPLSDRPVLTYEEVSKLPPYTSTLGMQPERPTIGMWLLDFNNVTMIRGTKEDIGQLVWAFSWNNPYFPIPEAESERDQMLWNVFSKTYLDKSSSIVSLVPDRQELSQEFIHACIERGGQSIANGLGRGWREPR